MAQLRVDFQEMLRVKEEQEEVLHRRERELSALKGALKEEVETHDSYMGALKEEYENELEKLLRDLDVAKEVTVTTRLSTIVSFSPKAKPGFHHLLPRPVSQSSALLGREMADAAEERGTAKVLLKDVSQDRDQLRGKVQELNNKVDQLSLTIQESKSRERLLEQSAKQLEVGQLSHLLLLHLLSFCHVLRTPLRVPCVSRGKSSRWRER